MIQDTRYDNEDGKNHKSFIKQAFRGAQYTVEKYCEKESSKIKRHFLFSQSLLLTHLLLYVYSVSRHINNHANQKINKNIDHYNYDNISKKYCYA